VVLAPPAEMERELDLPGAMPRRMLLVAHGYPPAQANGAEAQLRRKARWWAARGHDVRIVAADPQPSSSMPFGYLERREEFVDELPVTRLRIAVPDASRGLRETYEHPLLAAALEQTLADYAPDLIYQLSGYVFGVTPLLCAARHGVPSVLFATDFWHTCQRVTLLRSDQVCCAGPRSAADCAACRVSARLPARLTGSPLHRIARAAVAGMASLPVGPLAAALGTPDFAEREVAVADALRQVALVVSNSAFLANTFERLGVQKERLLVVRQGVDAAELSEPTSEAPRRGAAVGLRVLYLGQISRHKGVDLLLDAARQLQRTTVPFTLRLVGPITDTAAFEHSLRGALDDIIMLDPPQPREALAGLLGEADVVVVPSRWYENSPNVILEAFAAGVPVIAARHGGMAEMVRHEIDGLQFEPGNARALTAALQRMATEPELLAHLSRQIVKPYAIEHEMRVEEVALQRVMRATKRR
jgi:glycosyltransferase involved in cell wall biosynthesis